MPDDGGAACVVECLWLFCVNNLLRSLYKLKGVCHQIMFVLGVWWIQKLFKISVGTSRKLYL